MFRKIFGVRNITVAVALFVCISSAWSVNTYPRIEVNFQHPVIVNSETLAHGQYVFEQVQSKGNVPVFRVIDVRGNNLTLTSIAFTARALRATFSYLQPAATGTEVVLDEIGGKYYLHRIWIKGRTRGWEFQIPPDAKVQVAEKKESSYALQHAKVDHSYRQ